MTVPNSDYTRALASFLHAHRALRRKRTVIVHHYHCVEEPMKPETRPQAIAMPVPETKIRPQVERQTSSRPVHSIRNPDIAILVKAAEYTVVMMGRPIATDTQRLAASEACFQWLAYAAPDKLRATMEAIHDRT